METLVKVGPAEIEITHYHPEDFEVCEKAGLDKRQTDIVVAFAGGFGLNPR